VGALMLRHRPLDQTPHFQRFQLPPVVCDPAHNDMWLSPLPLIRPAHCRVGRGPPDFGHELVSRLSKQTLEPALSRNAPSMARFRVSKFGANVAGESQRASTLLAHRITPTKRQLRRQPLGRVTSFFREIAAFSIAATTIGQLSIGCWQERAAASFLSLLIRKLPRFAQSRRRKFCFPPTHRSRQASQSGKRLVRKPTPLRGCGSIGNFAKRTNGAFCVAF